MCLQDHRFSDLLTRAERLGDQVLDAQQFYRVEQPAQAGQPAVQAVDQQLVRLSNKAYYILMHLLEGPPLTLVYQHTGNDGFEVWRQLYRRYQLPQGPRSVVRKDYFELSCLSSSSSSTSTDLNMKWPNTKLKLDKHYLTV